MEKLYLVMPAYNEEASIESVIEQWYPVLEGKSDESRLVIADSGSTDKTHKIIEKMKMGGYSKLEFLTNTNQYHGPKLIALYDYAIKSGADYIFQTDSDGQTDPAEFETFWEERSLYSGIFGNRTVREDGEDRAFVERVVCLLIKLFFGVNSPDANAPFRLMKADVVKKYLYKLPSDYSLTNIMMVVYFSYYKEKIAYKKISFKPRLAGQNSVDIPSIVKIGIKALGDFFRLRKEMR